MASWVCDFISTVTSIAPRIIKSGNNQIGFFMVFIERSVFHKAGGWQARSGGHRILFSIARPIPSRPANQNALPIKCGTALRFGVGSHHCRDSCLRQQCHRDRTARAQGRSLRGIAKSATLFQARPREAVTVGAKQKPCLRIDGTSDTLVPHENFYPPRNRRPD